MVINSEKEQLRSNLKSAVCNCKKLKIGNHCLKSSFVIKVNLLNDLTEDKYQDGIHSYNMDCSIKINNNKGDCIEERCDIHFDAQIKGTDVDIVNGIVIVDRNFIPYNFLNDLNF